MEFKNLLDMYKAGVCKVRCNADGTFTFAYNTAAPITLSAADARKLMTKLGWKKIATTYDKAASHMGGIIGKFKSNMAGERQFSLSFEHSCISDTTKNVWRTRVTFKNGKTFTIVEGISGLGGKYAVMSSEDSFTSAEGFQKMDEAVKYIFEKSTNQSIYSSFTDAELEEMAKDSSDEEMARDAQHVLSARKKAVIKEDTKASKSAASATTRKAFEEELEEVKNITAGLY